MELDPLLSVTLMDFELCMPPDIFHRPKSTLLVGNIQNHDESRVIANLMTSPFGSIRNLDEQGFSGFHLTDYRILVECDLEMKSVLLESTRVMLFDFTITCGYDPLPERAYQFRKGETGVFIPLDHTITKQHWTFDLFSGGYGGWKFGLDIVQQYLTNFADEMTYPHHCVIGIDHDLPAVTQSSINHSAILLPDQGIPNDFFVHNECDTIFHAPIQSVHWKQSVALIRPDWWTMSFPCQPWTSSAKAMGFGDTNGRAFAYAIGLLRVFRPRLCLLENVKGFADHPQFPLAIKLFRWAGYHVIHQGIYEAATHLPIRRPRFLAMLARMEDQQRIFHWKNWGEGVSTNPKAWDAFFPTTPAEAVPFTPSPDAKRLYLDPSLLPSGAPESAKNSMLAYRIPDPFKKLPTMMAAYGEHHMIPNYLLKQKGLHGFFTSEHGSFRWFQPIEMAIMHLQTTPFTLLKPSQLAWHSIGNSIVTVHSVLAIANLFAYHFQDFEDTHIPAMIENMIKNRLRYSSTMTSQDEFAWYAGTQEQIHELSQKVRFISEQMGWCGKESPTWPSGQFFHPAKGRCSIWKSVHDATTIDEKQSVISPTLQFQAYEIEQPMQVIESVDPMIGKQVEDGYEIDTSSATDEEFSTQELLQALQHHTAEDHVPPVSQESKAVEQIAQDANMTEHCTSRIMIAAIPGQYGELSVLSDTTWDQLLPLWDCKFLPHDDLRMQSPHFVTSAILANDDGYIGNEYMCPHLFVDHNLKTTLFIIEDKQSWETVVNEMQLSDQLWFDDVGQVQSYMQLPWVSRISTEAIDIQPFVELPSFMQSFREVKIQARIPRNTDVLVIHLEGSTEQLTEIATFWHVALSKEWTEHHGRKRCFQALSSTTCQFLFPPHGNKWASPALDFKTFIVNRLIRVGIYSVSQYANPMAIPVEFKYQHRVHNPCYLPSDMSFEFFIALFQHATWIINFGNAPGIVEKGKRIGDIVTVEEISGHHPIRCHIVDPLVGGGPSYGSKGQHKQAVHAALAAMLIEEGLQLSKVSEAVKSLIDQMGLPSLTHMLFAEPSSTRDHSFRTMCTNCDIQLPTKPSKIAKTQAKFQKIARDENHRNNRNIDVSKYRLLPEYFRLEDGSAAPINTAFSPCVSGVTMVNSQQANQWITQKGKLSPDELALFIVGDIGVDDDERLEKFSVPAYNEQGDKVLIGGWLLQLGEKQVTTISADKNAVQTLDVRICSVTLWASDFSPDQWKIAVEQPVKFAKKLLEYDQLHQAIKSPWGRSMRAGKHPAGPQTATSVQFHCEVRVKDLRALLRRSGFNKVYVLPKDDEGKPDNSWRIIWTDVDITKLETVATPIAGTAGLVKGNRSYGLRVEQAAFTTVWDILHPGRQPPDQVPKGSLWKATPTPIGLDKDIIQEWAKKNAWECYPIKSLGSKTWLIQAAAPPSNELMCFNGSPIIIRKVPPRSNQPQTGLLAGPKSSASNDREAASIFQKGDPFLDSWANWRPSTSQPSSTAGVSTRTDSSVGPTTSRLDLQDKKIHELQQAVEKIHLDTKQKTADDDRRFATIEANIAQNHEQVQTSFQTLRSDFESTLQRAMSVQDQKIGATMDEIKALFLRGSKRSKSREPSHDEDDQM